MNAPSPALHFRPAPKPSDQADEDAKRQAALAQQAEQARALARVQANLTFANEFMTLRHLQQAQVRANPLPVPGNPLLMTLGARAGGAVLTSKGLTASILRKVSGEYIEHTVENAIERTVEMLKEGKVELKALQNGKSLKEMVLDPDTLKKSGQGVREILKAFFGNLKDEVKGSSLKETTFSILGEKAQDRFEEALIGKRGRRALKIGRMAMG